MDEKELIKDTLFDDTDQVEKTIKYLFDELDNIDDDKNINCIENTTKYQKQNNVKVHNKRSTSYFSLLLMSIFLYVQVIMFLIFKGDSLLNINFIPLICSIVAYFITGFLCLIPSKQFHKKGMYLFIALDITMVIISSNLIRLYPMINEQNILLTMIIESILFLLVFFSLIILMLPILLSNTYKIFDPKSIVKYFIGMIIVIIVFVIIGSSIEIMKYFL